MSNDRFHALTPSQFENLAYDLLTWRGMRNAAWRTPGADGGRDIEGSYEVQDLSGAHQSQKWYVDCKRYASSVGWPTVYEKLSYADSNGADFLLIVCTPSVSPQCRTEIDKWNAKSPKTKIRTWEPHYLERHHDMLILTKGSCLTNPPRQPAAMRFLLLSKVEKIVLPGLTAVSKKTIIKIC